MNLLILDENISFDKVKDGLPVIVIGVVMCLFLLFVEVIFYFPSLFSFTHSV